MSGLRPRTLAVIAGTATEVGKTWVAVHLAAELRASGWRVAARKPVQSFDPDDALPTDAEQLAAATGESPERVCPRTRWYERAMAPPMAAEALGRAGFTLADLAAELAGSWPRAGAELGLVELAGGPRSPLASDGDGVELTRALAPAFVVLVADAGLGTLNAVRLSADAFAPLPLLLHLNRFDAANELHRRNRAWLERRCGFAPTSDLRALVAAFEARLPLHCGGCGRERARCAGGCGRPLEPPRFCTRCGRELVAQGAGVGQPPACREHGALAS